MVNFQRYKLKIVFLAAGVKNYTRSTVHPETGCSASRPESTGSAGTGFGVIHRGSLRPQSRCTECSAESAGDPGTGVRADHGNRVGNTAGCPQCSARLAGN